jgi:hypothetical protein
MQARQTITLLTVNEQKPSQSKQTQASLIFTTPDHVAGAINQIAGTQPLRHTARGLRYLARRHGEVCATARRSRSAQRLHLQMAALKPVIDFDRSRPLVRSRTSGGE